jgi:hypothetical protein
MAAWYFSLSESFVFLLAEKSATHMYLTGDKIQNLLNESLFSYPKTTRALYFDTHILLASNIVEGMLAF